MAKSGAPKAPSQTTIKRLFALSGNLCAFPKCRTRLVSRDCKTIVGEVCHIRGDKPTAPRHDPIQTDRDRHAAGNLILLCGTHHKVIDDQPAKYPIEALTKMKEMHEAKHSDEQVDGGASKAFTSRAVQYFVTQGSVIRAENISGGQVAHSITNIYQVPPDDEVQISASTTLEYGLDLVNNVGCPCLILKVVCQSKRPAKIRRAMVCVIGKQIMASFQEGFGHDFGYTPPPWMPDEQLRAQLFPMQKLSNEQGFIIQQDESAQFLLPVLAGPIIGLAAGRPANESSLRVEFFDGSEQEVIGGEEVRRQLEGLIQIARTTKCSRRFPPIKIEVKVDSVTMPDLELLGKLNANPVNLVADANAAQVSPAVMLGRYLQRAYQHFDPAWRVAAAKNNLIIAGPIVTTLAAWLVECVETHKGNKAIKHGELWRQLEGLRDKWVKFSKKPEGASLYLTYGSHLLAEMQHLATALQLT